MLALSIVNVITMILIRSKLWLGSNPDNRVTFIKKCWCVLPSIPGTHISPHLSLMQVHRNQLPIAAYRNEIINTLETSQILVLSGETGW